MKIPPKFLHRLIYRVSVLRNILAYCVNVFQLQLLGFYKDKNVIRLISSTKKEVDFLFSPDEAFIIYSIAKAQSILEGDMAEVGVFQGGSARLICEAKGKRKLHLFDTFRGLEKVSNVDTHFGGIRFWREKEFSKVDLESVREYLSRYDNVFLYPGEFPATGDPIKHARFSFVHLDADLYTSTLASLQFFYPKLISGGIILCHDYHSDGIKRAFGEFFKDSMKPIIELPSSQCIVVK